MAFCHFLKKAEWRNDAFRYFPLLSATSRHFPSFCLFQDPLENPYRDSLFNLIYALFFFSIFWNYLPNWRTTHKAWVVIYAHDSEPIFEMDRNFGGSYRKL